jgi:hypothetical protein
MEKVKRKKMEKYEQEGKIQKEEGEKRVNVGKWTEGEL